MASIISNGGHEIVTNRSTIKYRSPIVSANNKSKGEKPIPCNYRQVKGLYRMLGARNFFADLNFFLTFKTFFKDLLIRYFFKREQPNTKLLKQI